jgi:CubicO group peptidase (beta-lactamase class C family)
MYGDQHTGGLAAEALGGIAPMLQGVVDAGDLSGVVTLVWRKGEVAQVNALGYRDIAARAPMSRDTLFRIASMTKPVTSVAAMMLIEEGRLNLEDPVSRWIPELSGLQVLKDPQGPLDATYPAPREITVEDLMTHRAGLAYAFSAVGPLADAYEAALGSPFAPPLTPDQWLAALGTLPLIYPPGERFHYSQATEVLGFLVARLEGKPLGQVLRERIFGPLGMEDTFFWCPPQKRDRLARLYRAPPEGGPLQDVSLAIEKTPPAFEAGGAGLISTADDYLRFARMMLGGGAVDGVRLLAPQTIALMTRNRLTEAQREIPFLGMPRWASQGFGLGVSVIVDPEKHAWMGAGSKGAFGWPGAFGTWWQADPAEEMVMIYLIQNSMPLEPGSAAQLAAGQPMAARAALPVFQKLVYAALGR